MQTRRSMPDETPAAAEAIDPVCGMTVIPSKAAGHVDYRGHEVLLLQSVLRRAVPSGAGVIP